MSDTELKTCPFCGGEADIEIHPFGKLTYFNPQCTACNCEIGLFETEAEAIEAWNRRAVQELIDFGNASFEIVESEHEFNFTLTLAERVKIICSRKNEILDIKYSVAVRPTSVRVYTALIIYRRVNE